MNITTRPLYRVTYTDNGRIHEVFLVAKSFADVEGLFNRWTKAILPIDKVEQFGSVVYRLEE